MIFKKLKATVRVNLKLIVGNIIKLYNKNRKSPTKINVFLESLFYFLSKNSWPDFHNPKTFSEYICNVKFFGKLEELAFVADKVRIIEKVKNEVGEKYLLKNYAIIDDLNDIDISKYESFPKMFVAKPNHASQRVFINIENNFDLFQTSVKSFFEEYGNEAQELHYKLIQPKLIIQELITPTDKRIFDFKFYVFHGRVELILVHLNLLKNNEKGINKAIIYTRDWKISEVQRRLITVNPIERPERLDEMIYVAETLGKDWTFMRVDMYLYDNIIKFGELSPTPLGGRGNFYPDYADRLLYEKFIRSSKL